jgi:DNA-binding PucR family transcriptional regulator
MMATLSPMPVEWDPPSPEAAELLRAAARRFLDHADELLAQLDGAVMAVFPERLRTDVTLANEAAASNRANILHWATRTVSDPGGRVSPNISPEVLAIARDAVRRGEDQILPSAYHSAQNVAWRYTMQLLLSISSDEPALAEALDVAARSIFQFVDDTVAALQERVELERAQLTRGTHAERLEVVNLILEGAPLTSERASARLGYELRGRHTAAIVWSDPATANQADLDRAAEAVAKAAGADRPLTVIASGSSLWVWFAGLDNADPGMETAAVEDIPGVRVALGLPGAGIEGFRHSHLDALATQRLMHNLPGELRLARFADVELVALAATDIDRAAEFVVRTLGELVTSDPELRDTLRAYIREQCSTSRTARALFAHRNTVLGRLRRAEQLLPLGLETRSIEVGVALEILYWLGPQLATT